MYNKVLIANRGEIALRILRTLREMGITPVAVYSDADRESRYVLEADEAYRIGPPPAPLSYLNREALIQTALASGCQAIHPGYGFLAENADFVDEVTSAGLTFIGPSSSTMRAMGDKIAARQLAQRAGVPVVPGSDAAVEAIDVARAFVVEHGLPVLIKAGGGGGGRGIRVVEQEEMLAEAMERASNEADTYFHNPQVYLERFFRGARHIEIQVAGDSKGEVVAWGERDCSTQRRRQKLIEETPAPGISPSERTEMMDAAVRFARSAAYVGVGTVEFLYAGPGEFYFLEMNTRIQVEHTITEQVTNLDLVRESIELSCGKSVEKDIQPRGHAIEARINAEDPARGFAPGPGLIEIYREPGGQGVRIDSGVYQGFAIPGDYDSLVAKLVVHAPDRERAIARMLRALRGYHVEGIPTTIPLIQRIVASDTFRSGSMTTDWLDANLDSLVTEDAQPVPASVQAAAPPRRVDVEVNGKRFEVRIYDEATDEKAATGRRERKHSHTTSKTHINAIISPMHGTVLAVNKAVGDHVAEGEAVFVIEAMKMENEVLAPRGGSISAMKAALGDTVDAGQILAELSE